MAIGLVEVWIQITLKMRLGFTHFRFCPRQILKLHARTYVSFFAVLKPAESYHCPCLCLISPASTRRSNFRQTWLFLPWHEHKFIGSYKSGLLVERQIDHNASASWNIVDKCHSGRLLSISAGDLRNGSHPKPRAHRRLRWKWRTENCRNRWIEVRAHEVQPSKWDSIKVTSLNKVRT